MAITVYSNLVCGQCDATYRALFAAGIDFEVVLVQFDDEAKENVKKLGYLQAPVVITDEDHWSGFCPDKIDEVVTRLDGLTPISFTEANAKFQALKKQLKDRAEELVAA